MSDVILSPSSVDAYRRCHYRWYLSYVERHEGVQSIEALVGSAVHAAAETFLTSRVKGASPQEATAPAIDDLLLTYNLGALSLSGDVASMRAIAIRTGLAYLVDVLWDRNPLWIEHAGLTDINGVRFSCYTDLVWGESWSDGHVWDLKVKGAKPRRPADYLFQLIGNALSWRAETGEREADVGLDVMMRLKQKKPYNTLYQYHGPVSEVDIGRFAAVLEAVADGIERGDFEPTGLEEPGICNYCPVNAVCQPFHEFVNARGRT